MYYKHLIFIFRTIKHVCSLYTFSSCCQNLVPVDEDAIWPAEEEDVRPGCKPLTARQKWTMANFQFLSAHQCIWADHSQLGRVHTPALQVDPEGEDEG